MTLYALKDIKPSLPDGFHWIAPNATVIGNVNIGINVGIWFGAVLRGDNEPITIGDDTNIQEDCVFHTDSGFPGRNWQRLYDWPQSDGARMQDWRQFAGGNGSYDPKRRKNWQ